MTDSVNVPREVVMAALNRVLPVSYRDGPDYAELTFGESQTQAMNLEPETWMVLNDIPVLLAAAPKAEAVSDPYKLVTAADIIAWVKNHPYPTSWVATANDIKTIVETMKPDQSPEAPKVEQEPVAWRYRSAERPHLGWTKPEYSRRSPYGRIGMDEQPLYTHPAPDSDELLSVIIELVEHFERVDGDAEHKTIISKATNLYAQHKGPQS